MTPRSLHAAFRRMATVCALSLLSSLSFASQPPFEITRETGFDSRGVFWRVTVSRDGSITASGDRTWTVRPKAELDYLSSSVAQEGDVIWTADARGKAVRVDLRTGAFVELTIKASSHLGPKIAVHDGLVYFRERNGPASALAVFNPKDSAVSRLATFTDPEDLLDFAVSKNRVWAVSWKGWSAPQASLRVTAVPRSGGASLAGVTVQRAWATDRRSGLATADDGADGLWISDPMSQTVYHIDGAGKSDAWPVSPFTSTSMVAANGIAVVRLVSLRTEDPALSPIGPPRETLLDVQLAAFGARGRLSQMRVARDSWSFGVFLDAAGAIRLGSGAWVQWVEGALRVTTTAPKAP